MSTIAGTEVAKDRPGLDVRLGDGRVTVCSPTWRLGGWSLRFVRLAADQEFPVDGPGEHFVKVVLGRLTQPDLRAYAAPFAVRSTRLLHDVVRAGGEGAVLTLLSAGVDGSDEVTSMDQLAFDGPHAPALAWQSFEQKFAGKTTWFDGQDAHIAPGFHLLDGDGAEIAYVHVWTAGKGADMSTHNHGRDPSPRAPAFAEVHLVLHNGTGRGGMYLTSEPGAPQRERFPVQRGEEHGPFFAVDAQASRPRLRDNGAVEYPWHGWEAGTDDRPGQSYDVVMAFEITVPYARL